MKVNALRDYKTGIVHWVLGRWARGRITMPTSCGLNLEAVLPDDAAARDQIDCPKCQVEYAAGYLDSEP